MLVQIWLLVFVSYALAGGGESTEMQDAGLVLLRTVLRVGGTALCGDALSAARQTEHALRAFCAMNDVALANEKKPRLLVKGHEMLFRDERRGASLG